MIWLCEPMFQEKKGAAAPDPAARDAAEIAKLDKILLMVRDPADKN